MPDRPRNTKDLRAEVPPKRTERHVPHGTKPPRHTGRGSPGRAAHSGPPPPTAQAHPRQAREGPCGPATGRLGAATATPEGATRLHPTPQQHRRWSHRRPRPGHFLSLLLPPHPQDTPIAKGHIPSESSPTATARAYVLPRLAHSGSSTQHVRNRPDAVPPPGGARAVCPSATCGLSWNESRTPDDVDSGACRTAEDRRRQRWRKKVRAQVHQQPPSSPGLRGLLFKPSFHFPSMVMNLFSACNSGARALPQSLPASGAQELPLGSLATDKGQAAPGAHPRPPAGLGESEPGPQAASHPWEGALGSRQRRLGTA